MSTVAAPVFDAESLLNHLGGDQELARNIIESAMGDLPKYFDALEKALAGSDVNAAARLIHTMKGLAAQLGGTRLSMRFKEVEDQLKRGGEIEVNALGDLRQEQHILVEALQRWTRAS